MSLRRRWFIAFGSLSFLGVLFAVQAQEATQGPALFSKQSRVKDTGELTRTGARKTAVVAAIERVKGAVVNIHSERSVAQNPSDRYSIPAAPKAMNGMGTGIIIDSRGFIVTNQHVVEDVTALRIRLVDGTTYSAVIIARNPELDLALIKIDPSGPLPVMPIGTAHDLMIGETVITIGNAFGYEHTASVGIVSATKRDVSLNQEMSYKSLIQTDACINPGNSGGPLINVHGDLVGVNVAIRAGAQGIGFAIPVDHMVKAVGEMLRKRRRTAAYDGFACRDLLQSTNDGFVRNVVIDRIDSSSPAEAAGLRNGDVIVQVGDVKVGSGIDVERGLLDARPGDSVSLVVRRKDQEKHVQLPIADLVWQKLGVQLATVRSDAVSRANRQLHGGLEVTSISSTGPAARAGLRKGDILVGLHSWETVSVDNVTYVLNHRDLASFNPVPFFILRDGQIQRGQVAVLP
ncbi:MAG TPA: trypsin-like peptidase domain-containing protein [Gemmataceae bacterium]|nr:trypsin-like peptidase domain-containing protein [Gemmataceae bacterium]